MTMSDAKETTSAADPVVSGAGDRTSSHKPQRQPRQMSPSRAMKAILMATRILGSPWFGLSAGALICAAPLALRCVDQTEAKAATIMHDPVMIAEMIVALSVLVAAGAACARISSMVADGVRPTGAVKGGPR